MTWAIKTGWRFDAVEVVKETEKMVSFIDGTWGQTRAAKEKLSEWRGDEETARSLAAKLTSAKAEYNRRSAAASEWYENRKAEIFAGAEA